MRPVSDILLFLQTLLRKRPYRSVDRLIASAMFLGLDGA